MRFGCSVRSSAVHVSWVTVSVTPTPPDFQLIILQSSGHLLGTQPPPPSGPCTTWWVTLRLCRSCARSCTTSWDSVTWSSAATETWRSAESSWRNFSIWVHVVLFMLFCFWQRFYRCTISKQANNQQIQSQYTALFHIFSGCWTLPRLSLFQTVQIWSESWVSNPLNTELLLTLTWPLWVTVVTSDLLFPHRELHQREPPSLLRLHEHPGGSGGLQSASGRRALCGCQERRHYRSVPSEHAPGSWDLWGPRGMTNNKQKQNLPLIPQKTN